MADELESRGASAQDAPPPQLAETQGNVNVMATSSSQAVAQPPAPTTLPVARALPGEHQIARLLRMGAVMAGSCFAVSVGLELLPPSTLQAQAIDLLRKGGAMLLIMTPITRLIAAGVMLGVRGEWRYALYAGVILTLISVALGAGLHG